MQATSYVVYSYRWVLLGVFALFQGVVQLLWITFAPITGPAAAFYGVSALHIGLLSMMYMLVYLFVSIPASWILDRYGLRVGLGIAALLVAVFGGMRGAFGARYDLVLVATVGISIAQPFVLNSITKFSAHWFPVHERATAAGIVVLVQALGLIVGMSATPLLSHRLGIPGALQVYGVATVVIAMVFLAFFREHPPTPPCAPGEEDRLSVREGLRHILSGRPMRIVLLAYFVGLGIFNGITTWIEQVVGPRGFDATQAGAVGAVMMLAGMAGATILPVISDRTRRRQPIMLVALMGATPGLVGLTFATTYAGLLVASAVYGFFAMAAGAIIYQYTAELCHPAPEATSQGLLVMSGQISGVVFVYAMDAFRNEAGAMTPSLLGLVALALFNVYLTTRLPESRLIRAAPLAEEARG